MARGGFWGGREVKQCPVVYVAAEGSGGIKKRIVGLKNVAAEKGLPADIPFHLVNARSGQVLQDSKKKDFVPGCERLQAEKTIAIWHTYVWLAK
jgi:hypothetical protein